MDLKKMLCLYYSIPLIGQCDQAAGMAVGAGSTEYFSLVCPDCICTKLGLNVIRIRKLEQILFLIGLPSVLYISYCILFLICGKQALFFFSKNHSSPPLTIIHTSPITFHYCTFSKSID